MDPETQMNLVVIMKMMPVLVFDMEMLVVASLAKMLNNEIVY